MLTAGKGGIDMKDIIRLEKIPGKDAYKVFSNHNRIGYARPEHNGEYSLTAYGHGPNSLSPTLDNLEDINIRINELVKY